MFRVVLGCWLLIVAAVVTAAPPVLSPTPADAWPLFRGNSHGSGVAGSTLPDKLELLWKFSVENGAFDATPAISDGIVVIGDLDGRCYALGLNDGKERWRVTSEDGFSAAPAIRDGRVYIGDSAGKFQALDLTTGKVFWTYAAQGQLYGANFFGDTVLVGAQDGTLHCLKAGDGTLVWKYQIPDQIRCTPSLVAGRAFLVGCDGKLHIVDVALGKSLGSVALDAPAGTTAACGPELAFFGTSAGEFLAVKWATAARVWSYQDKARQQAISGSAALGETVVYVPGEDRTLRAFDQKSGKELWKTTFRGKLESSPVLVGERLFQGGHDGKLHALDVSTGKRVWEYETGGKLIGSPAVASQRLVIASDDGYVYCFGAK